MESENSARKWNLRTLRAGPPHRSLSVKVDARAETPERANRAVGNAFTFVFGFDDPVGKVRGACACACRLSRRGDWTRVRAGHPAELRGGDAVARCSPADREGEDRSRCRPPREFQGALRLWHPAVARCLNTNTNTNTKYTCLECVGQDALAASCLEQHPALWSVAGCAQNTWCSACLMAAETGSRARGCTRIKARHHYAAVGCRAKDAH